MNNDIVQGKWKQVSGTLKANWGKLTDDDLLEINGNLEKFQGKMQEKYGMAKDEAKKEFEKSHLQSCHCKLIKRGAIIWPLINPA